MKIGRIGGPALLPAVGITALDGCVVATPSADGTFVAGVAPVDPDDQS